MKILFLILCISLTACSCIKYESDIGFLNSAQANSMEYLVKVGDSVCRDVDGLVGLCAKRVKSNRPLKFKHESRPYGYRFHFRCSSSINSDFSVDVDSDQAFNWEIKPNKFEGVKSFTCVGEVFPEDRDQEVSAAWHVRIIVIDGDYLPRESIYESVKSGKKLLILGKHAKYGVINGKSYKKKPTIKIKKPIKFAYSESERCRFNYYFGE